MESLMAFIVTFSAAVPAFILAAVFLSCLKRRMRLLRRADIEPREKRLRGIIGAAASLVALPLQPPVLYLAARGTEAAEIAMIVSAVFNIPLSYFVLASLAASVRAIVSAGRR